MIFMIFHWNLPLRMEIETIIVIVYLDIVTSSGVAYILNLWILYVQPCNHNVYAGRLIIRKNSKWFQIS